MVVPRWTWNAARRAALFFALKGQPEVSLGHSAATPQDLVAYSGSSPEGETRFRDECRPFRAGFPLVVLTQGGAARLRRCALP